MKKRLALSLAMLMLLACGIPSLGMAGGGEAPAQTAEVTFNENGVSGPGMLPITREITEIEVFAPVSETFTEEGSTVLQEIEAATNIRIKIVERPISDTDANTTKNLLMASNNYPEMFLLNPPNGFTQSEMLQYGVKDGSFLPLNDMMAEYGYWLTEMYEEYPEFEKIMRAPDGNIYGINGASECGHCLAYPKLWIRTDWLETLGLEIPTTTDELYDVLYAFKTMDPNGNGIADEIPLTADVDETIDAVLMNSFLPYFPKVGQWINGANFCYADADGQVIFSGTQDAFKDGLAYMAKLYADGLVDIAAFTQTNAQGKVTICTEPYPVGAFVAMHLGQLIDTSIPELYANYHAIVPVAGPDGVRFAAYNPSINDNTKALGVITDKCKNPEAAFRLLDYMLNPHISYIKEFGVEGVDWNYAEPGQENIMGGEYVYEKIVNPTGSEEDNTFGDRRFYYGPRNMVIEERAKFAKAVDWEILNTDTTFTESRLESETYPLIPYFYEYILPNSLFMEADDAEEFTELASVINTYMMKSVAQFATGDLTVENDWDTYLSELERYNLPRFLELYQAAFDNYNAN